METTIAVAEEVTLEFGSEKIDTTMSAFGKHKEHFGILKAGFIKVRVDLSTPPFLEGNGQVIRHEAATVTQLLHRAYSRDNAANVAIPGWGPGYLLDEDPESDWAAELHSSICTPYTELLREESLEALAARLLADGDKLRHDFLERYFETLVRGRYQLNPSDDEFAALLKAFEQREKPGGPFEENPFYQYVDRELPERLNAEQFQHSGRILIADRKDGHFEPKHGRFRA